MSKVVIVDYGLGNLYSIQNALKACGLSAVIASEKKMVEDAPAVILPGVGSFRDAMVTLRRLDLVKPLQDFAQTGKPLIGICLGIQLLMTESQEFGLHKGLDIIPGEVVPLDRGSSLHIKVPQVGWNRLIPQRDWSRSYIEGITERDFFYFVHSYKVVPVNDDVVLSNTMYIDTAFCSTLQKDNVFACQCHPERSAESGMKIYRHLAARLNVK